MRPFPSGFNSLGAAALTRSGLVTLGVGEGVISGFGVELTVGLGEDAGLIDDLGVAVGDLISLGEGDCEGDAVAVSDTGGVSMRYRTASFMSTWRGGANGDGMSVRRVNLKHGEEMSQLRFIRGYSRGDLWDTD